jgi:hypothetical protein
MVELRGVDGRIVTIELAESARAKVGVSRRPSSPGVPVPVGGEVLPDVAGRSSDTEDVSDGNSEGIVSSAVNMLVMNGMSSGGAFSFPFALRWVRRTPVS